MKNNTSLKIEMNRNRNIALSLANNQITETKGNELVIGAGYIIKDVKFNFIRVGANKKAVVSNLELKGDLTIRDNQTVIRRILEDITQVTAGQRIVTIKLSADYQLSRRVTTRIFYDQVISTFNIHQHLGRVTHYFFNRIEIQPFARNGRRFGILFVKLVEALGITFGFGN